MNDLVTAPVIAAWARQLGHDPITPATVRQWARRGHIKRHGRTDAGATLYSLTEVQEFLRTRRERLLARRRSVT